MAVEHDRDVAILGFHGRSPYLRPPKIARHHPFVHFRRPVIDSHGPKLGRHLLQRQLLGHAHRAEALHRVVDDFGGHFGREGLDHRHLEADVATLVQLPGAVVGHQPGPVDLGRGVGDPPLDGLALGKRLAEGHPLRRIVDDHVERALGHADRPGRHLDPPGAKAKLHGRKALPLGSEQLPALDAAILERDLVGDRAADHGDAAKHIEAGRSLIDQEGGYAAARAFPCL